MSAAKVNLIIEQGATFAKSILWKDSDGDAIDISGYTVTMQVRENLDSVSPILTGASGNGGTISITLEAGAVTGLIDILITAANTANLDFVKASYDIEANDGSDVITRLMEGTITLSKEITR